MIKISRNILFSCIMLISSLASADICTDDYIISGGRAIPLLPDQPFEILETDLSLTVRRGTFILEFVKPTNILKEKTIAKRYSLDFIGDKYYFELSTADENNDRKWEQYANEEFKRGFGGLCKVK